LKILKLVKRAFSNCDSNMARTSIISASNQSSKIWGSGQH